MFDWLSIINADRMAYFSGRIACLLLYPFFRVQDRGKVRSNPYVWQNFGFHYVNNGRRYLYRESVEWIGVLSWLIALAVLWAVLR